MDGRRDGYQHKHLTMDDNKLLAAIEKERREAKKSCWEYHGEAMKSDIPSMTRATMIGDMYDFNLDEDADIGYYIGYFRGLDMAEEIIINIA